METRKEIRKALVIFTSPLIILFGGTVLTFLLFKDMIEKLIQDRKKPVSEPEPEHNPKVIRREAARVQTDEVESTAENDKSLLDGVEHIREYQIKLNRKTVFSTHYALMVECFERILIDLLNETTKEDTIVVHRGVYERLRTNCKRMNETNVIIYKKDDYQKAKEFMQTKTYYMNDYYFINKPDAFFDDTYPMLLFNSAYGQNDRGIRIFDHHYHTKHRDTFKNLLNSKGIRVDHGDFVDTYFDYFVCNYLSFRSPKSRHAIGVSKDATTHEIDILCNETLQTIGYGIQSGINLNFLIPSLLSFLEDPTSELINELVTRKPCDLPWVINDKHGIKKAWFHLHQEGKHSLFIETEKYIIHCQKDYYDNNCDYMPAFVNFYNADGSPVLLLGIETEANTDGLDILAMYSENMTAIENFDYDEDELKKAHLNCVIDAEQLLYRIKGHTLDRLDSSNVDNEFI